jgi:hypothetical protein
MSNPPLTLSDDEVDGLAYVDNISVSWEPVDNPPDDQHLALVNESNETFLRAVAAIGELPKERASEELSDLSQEISRIDNKINLLLELVGQLVYQSQSIPETTLVKLNATHIEWRGSDIPKPHSQVFIKAYIQRGTPRPLCFYGDVISSPDEYANGIARVKYLGLSDGVIDWVVKLIFRHHRRLVAHQHSRDKNQPGE